MKVRCKMGDLFTEEELARISQIMGRQIEDVIREQREANRDARLLMAEYRALGFPWTPEAFQEWLAGQVGDMF